MKVVVNWSGGKECSLAYYKTIEQGHEVASLLTFKYMEPYVYHSLPVMALQSKTMGVPQVIIQINNPKDPMEEIQNAMARLRDEQGVTGFVTGDIAGAGCARVHQVHYELMCDDLNMKLLMPLENPSGDTYDVLKEEVGAGIRPVLNCVNTQYFGEDWVGRELNPDSIVELKELADKKGIDVCSEDGIGYHSMVLKASFFQEQIDIGKPAKVLFKDRRRTWMYLDTKEAWLKPKETPK